MIAGYYLQIVRRNYMMSNLNFGINGMEYSSSSHI